MATFGKTSIGSIGSWNWNWRSKIGCRFQAPDSGILTGLRFYGHIYSDVNPCYLAVYADNNGVPSSLLASGSVNIGIADDWWGIDGLSLEITAGTYYWLTVNWGNVGIYYWYSISAVNQLADQAEGADTPPPNDPFGSVANYYAREMSIYAIYSPLVVGGGEFGLKTGLVLTL